MKLLWAIFRWLFSNLFLLLAIVALVAVSTVISDWWEARRQQELQLQQLQNQLIVLDQQIKKKRHDLSLEQKLLDLHQNEPSQWTSPLEHYRWEKEMELLGGLLDKKNSEMRELRKKRDELSTHIEGVSENLHRTREKIENVIRKSVGAIAILAAVVFLGPLLWRAFWYYIVAGLARKAPPLRLEHTAEQDQQIRISTGQKNFPVTLEPSERLAARMNWIQQYTPSAGKKTRFMWDWKMPFISYAAGLSELTEFTAPAGESNVNVVLSSGQNPDTYVSEVSIRNHRGIVILPSQVVAISGDVQLKTRWCLSNPHAWIAGRLRHIIFSGTGKIYVEGSGGIDPVAIDQKPVRITEAVVTAFESGLCFSTARTETFWPYYRRHTPLFDYEFSGKGFLVRQTAPAANRKDTPTIRFIDSFLSAIGKLLGL